MEDYYDVQIKIILLGLNHAGKSSLIERYINKTFSELVENTIGVEFVNKIETRKDKSVKLNIWDTCGQENFSSFTRIYYQNADVILLVVDCKSLNSLKRAQKFVEEIKNNVNGVYHVFLVVTKIDLMDQNQTGDVSFIKSEQFYKNCKFYAQIAKMKKRGKVEKVFWVSSKFDIGVDALFGFIVRSYAEGRFKVDQNRAKDSYGQQLEIKSLISRKKSKKGKGGKKCC